MAPYPTASPVLKSKPKSKATSPESFLRLALDYNEGHVFNGTKRGKLCSPNKAGMTLSKRKEKGD